MLPKKYKAMSIYGEEVIGYPAPTQSIMTIKNHIDIETVMQWEMFVEDYSIDNVIMSSLGDNRTFFKTTCIPIRIETLQEIGD